jgi:hypothetical protein
MRDNRQDQLIFRILQPHLNAMLHLQSTGTLETAASRIAVKKATTVSFITTVERNLRSSSFRLQSSLSEIGLEMDHIDQPAFPQLIQPLLQSYQR